MTSLEILSRLFIPFDPRGRLGGMARKRRSGVYLMIIGSGISYIGSSLDMDLRFASHAERRHAGLIFYERVLWMPIPKSERVAYEGALIRALRPPGNRCTPSTHTTSLDNEILASLGIRPHGRHDDIRKDWSEYVRIRNATEASK